MGRRGSAMKKTLEKDAPEGTQARKFTTISGRPIEPLYGPAQVSGISHARDIGDPGVPPYTRGIHESMYRGKVWTMRQFAGFGSAAQTNARFKYLLDHG